MKLLFTVPGRAVSNNANARHGLGRSYKSAKATSFQQRVFQHAFAAAQGSGWVTPEACGVSITAINTRLDIDNIPKMVLDGMEGAAYANDSSVNKLTISKDFDLGEERLEIEVEVREKLVRPKKKPARKKAA